MASSRGRARLAERPQRRFVFGSSTPRELTHLSSVPAVLRAIDPQSQQEIAKRSPSMATSLLLFEEKPKCDLGRYVREAHHPPLVRNDSTNSKPFAFGSSTPREFSHLNKVQKALRVYDAKIVVKSDHPARSSSFANAYRKPRSISTQVRPKPQPAKIEDDVSSEPDIVQDRWYDNYPDKSKSQQFDDNKDMSDPSRTSTAEENVIPSERAVDMATEASAPMKVIKPTDHGISREPVVTVPVVPHDDSNPVLIEDNNVFELAHEAHSTASVVPLGELSDLGGSQTLSSPHRIENVIDEVLEKAESVAGDSNTQILILADEPPESNVHTLDDNPIEEERHSQTFSDESPRPASDGDIEDNNKNFPDSENPL
uniref:Ski_Sno domain-containing protein n=1 Tax=Panagrellus redivivus TaxID=6233 RepID=A0A7E4V9U3_PANRE